MTEHYRLEALLFERKVAVGVRELLRSGRFPDDPGREPAGSAPEPGAKKAASVTILCALAVVWCVAEMVSVGDEPDTAPVSEAMQDTKKSTADATRLVKQLELPERRDQVERELVRLGKVSVPHLIRALRDPRPEVVTAAARVLGFLDMQAQEAVPALVKQTRSKNAAVATAARWALGRMQRLGSTLIVDLADRLLEVDADKEVTFSLRVSGITDAKALPNGNYLVAVQEVTNPAAVMELTPSGKRVWTHRIRLSFDVDPLPGGRVLVADTRRGRVYELDRKGKTRWQYDCKNPLMADRLRSGNTLIVGGRLGAWEIDPSGKVVWRHRGHVMQACRLPGGNTLIASSRTVFEVEPGGKVVAKVQGLEEILGGGKTGVLHVQRLRNGNTLIGLKHEVIELGTSGKIKWRYDPLAYLAAATRR